MKTLKGKLAPPVSDARVVFYARVSTVDQNLALQTDAAERLGVHPDDMFVEKISATRKKRPELRKAIKHLQPGDTFVVWRLDRLGRSVIDLIGLVQEIEATGANFKSLTESIDTSTAVGQLYFNMVATIAQFERQLISERTRAGMQVLKDRGVKLGAKPKLKDSQWAEIERRLRETSALPKDMAKKYGVSVALIHKRFPGGKKALQKKRRRR